MSVWARRLLPRCSPIIRRRFRGRERTSRSTGEQAMQPSSPDRQMLQDAEACPARSEADEMETLIYEKRGQIAVLTINRPHAMNAYDADTIDAMGRRFEEFDADSSLRVAILTAVGEKSFCAGADLKTLHGKEFAGGIQELWDDARQYRLGQRVQVRKPVIAAINGYCLAGGLELALACDLRIASTTASFGCP